MRHHSVPQYFEDLFQSGGQTLDSYRNTASNGSYDLTTIWLHWTTVGLVAILWLIGQTADWIPSGPVRTGI
jgi:hypothetical protein